MKTTALLTTIAVILAVTACKKDTTPTTTGYFAKVKAIVQNHCLSCHSAITGTHQGMPTTLDTDEQIATNYANIKASVADPVTPGPLGNKRMPENDSLTLQQIDDIVQWYNKGGKVSD